jgi:hypothetical protein
MARTRGSKNKAKSCGEEDTKQRNDKKAPGECPKRSRCIMFEWYCKEHCEDYLGCLVWKKEE